MESAARASTRQSVFINCPFDRAYRPIFFASIFAVHYCGFLARSALEISDATQPRLHTICDLIVACRFGIHDLSRTGLEPANALPRFNMPFELGLFLGCQRFGGRRQRTKSALVSIGSHTAISSSSRTSQAKILSRITMIPDRPSSRFGTGYRLQRVVLISQVGQQSGSNSKSFNAIFLRLLHICS